MLLQAPRHDQACVEKVETVFRADIKGMWKCLRRMQCRKMPYCNSDTDYIKRWKLSHRVGRIVSRNNFLLFRKVRSETKYMVVVVEEAPEDPW